jgi:hypothetical protein
MTESLSPGTDPDAVEKEFAETLRQAAFIFEKEKNGRFMGSILACRAVARFIHQRNGGAELAGPFLQIAEAFTELERGGKPRLFAKKSDPEKERDRSPERRHIHMLAAAALEVMIKLTRGSSKAWDEDTINNKNDAAAMIARHVRKWPGMATQKITKHTVINWLNEQRRLSKSERTQFATVVEKILAEPDPRQALDRLLRSGPPGLWKS